MANYGTDRVVLQDTTGTIQSDDGAPLLSTQSEGGQSYALGPTLSAGIYSGVQNGNFASPPPAIGTASPLNDENTAPYFSFIDGSSGRITAAFVEDSAQASGYSVRFTIIGGSVGDEAYIERMVAMPASRAQAVGYQPRSTFGSATSATTYSAFTRAQYFKADGTTTTGSGGTGSRTGALIASSAFPLEIQANPNLTTVVPSDGAFLQVRAGVTVGTAMAGTATVDLVEVRLDNGRTQTTLVDSDSPNAYGYATTFLSSGQFTMRANETGLSGSNPEVMLRASVGDIIIDASKLGANGSAVVGGNVYLAHSPAGKVLFGGSAGAEFSDTNLYRSAADTLKTDDSLVVGGGLTVGGTVILGVPPGVVQSYLGATSNVPTGWILANGASLSTATYPALFAVIGYEFGGAGASFSVPNLNVGFFLVGSTSTPGSGFMTGSADSYLNTTWNHTHSVDPAAFNSAATTTAVVTASGSGAGPASLSHVHSINVPATTSSDAGPSDARRMRVVYIIKT